MKIMLVRSMAIIMTLLAVQRAVPAFAAENAAIWAEGILGRTSAHGTAAMHPRIRMNIVFLSR